MFVISFLLIYGGMQAFIYLRLLPLFHHIPVVRWLVMVWLILMTFAPILTHMLDHAPYPGWAKVPAWIGYSWMGISLLAFWLSLISYVIACVWFLVRRVGPWLPPVPDARVLGVTVLVLTLLLSAWAVYNQQDLRVQRFTLSTPALAPWASPVRVALISDVHLGLLAGEKTAQQIVDRLRQEQPDLILCTGDMVDSDYSSLDGPAAVFQTLHPKLGKYAVTGNHESYMGHDKAAVVFDRAGFTLLDNARQDIGSWLTLIGLDYGLRGRCGMEGNLVDDLDPHRFSIVLKHVPTVCPTTAEQANLQLSGHTHNGQIFPFGLIVRLVYPHIAGMYTLQQGMRLYVSQGTGSWGPKMRLGTQREITLITLQPKEAGGSGHGARGKG